MVVAADLSVVAGRFGGQHMPGRTSGLSPVPGELDRRSDDTAVFNLFQIKVAGQKTRQRAVVASRFD